MEEKLFLSGRIPTHQTTSAVTIHPVLNIQMLDSDFSFLYGVLDSGKRKLGKSLPSWRKQEWGEWEGQWLKALPFGKGLVFSSNRKNQENVGTGFPLPLKCQMRKNQKRVQLIFSLFNPLFSSTKYPYPFRLVQK